MATNDVQFSKTPVSGTAPASAESFLNQLAGLVRTGAELSASSWRNALAALGLSSDRRPRRAAATAPPQAGPLEGLEQDYAAVNPRIRAYGKARLDMAQRMHSQEDWERVWVPPRHSFPFRWQDARKHSFEYTVDEFAAEVGFFIDVLGFQVTAIGPDYAMFTSPDDAFHFAVVPTPTEGLPTPADTVCMQFMVADILGTAAELEKRGVVFESRPQPVTPGSRQLSGYFRTPNGVCVDLWGRAAAEKAHPGSPEGDRPQKTFTAGGQDRPASPEKRAKAAAGAG